MDKERPDLLIPYIHTLWNSLINLSNASEKKLLLDTRKNNFDAGSYIFPWFFFCKIYSSGVCKCDCLFFFLYFYDNWFPIIGGGTVKFIYKNNYSCRCFLHCKIILICRFTDFCNAKARFFKERLFFPLKFPIETGVYSKNPIFLGL